MWGRTGQYQALTNPDQCLRLAQLLVNCRGQNQRRLLLRGQRHCRGAASALQEICAQMEQLPGAISHTSSLEALRGIEATDKVLDVNRTGAKQGI
ncbi:CRISPR-associated endonuclease Cas1 [uncultured Thermosynechococcus sp.]|uniref:CRISPR-associated endonuclease Cas1 n=1 Tax=uncultured Thermosynechococcus sp. TaxID=436945 RepID=UPI00260E1B4C|nr:CRISPR-associated endonuclease Cas1 [uncultured Thermosynechococcus sp.]